jgi:DNA-binding transcriptional ArsR family regulator
LLFVFQRCLLKTENHVLHNAFMQKEQIRISNPEAAKTLQDSPVLHYFLEPASPSAVAKKVGIPANLVHHHAKRARELGILFEAKKEGRKVFYQLTARTFTHKRDLLGLEQTIGTALRKLSESFLESYLRCETEAVNASDPDYHVYGFGSVDDSLRIAVKSGELPLEHPAHYQVRTLCLGVEQYKTLIQTLARLLEETKSEKNAKPCTIALLGFSGLWRGGHEDTMGLSSFALEPNPA